MNIYYENTCVNYAAVPTAYSNDTTFGTADLGTYDRYNGIPMQRDTSGFSISSFDSAVPSECFSPTTTDSNYEFDNSQAPYFNDYSTHQSYSPTESPVTYTNGSTQAFIPRSTAEFQSPQMVQPLTTPPNSVQTTSKPAQWRCLHQGCKQKPFKRHADFERHLKHVHRSSTETFFCDYGKCSRSKGQTSDGADSDHAGAGGRVPFSRWDHFKAHLRDYHEEPIPKRLGCRESNINSNKFSHCRGFRPSWWRCSKCLKRNHVVNCDGYKCGHCSQSLEAAVVEERHRRFPDEGRTHR